MKPKVFISAPHRMTEDLSTLTPTTIRSITQILESDDCLQKLENINQQDFSNKTFVNLDSKCWQGGTTTVVTPTTKTSFSVPTVLIENHPPMEDGLKNIEPVNFENWGRKKDSKTVNKKRTAGRKPANSKMDEDLSPEEGERLKMRRLRNKEAAARCRKRRMDLTQTLMEQVEQHEAKKRALEQEIQQLKAHKDELQFILQAHDNGSCNLRQQVLAVKSEPVVVESVHAPYEMSRPQRPATLTLPCTSESISVPIETPSSIVPCLSFDNVTTGFTPTSGFAPTLASITTPTLSCIATPTLNTPQCGAQMHRSMMEEFGSQDLVSL